MRKVLSLQILALVVCLSSGRLSAEQTGDQTPETLAAQADRAYADASLDIQARRNAMDTMAAAGDRWRDNYDIQWRAARAIFAYGDMLYYEQQWENYNKALKKKKIKSARDVMDESRKMDKAQSQELMRLGTKARKYADKAVSLKPDGVEGNYYAALAIGLYAFGKSIISALWEGLGPQYEDHLNRALKAKKDFMDGALFAAYGRYWYKLPRPKRNNGRSLDYLLKAKAYSPDNTLNLDFLGDTYYALGKKEEAKRSWSAALDSPFRDFHGETVKELIRAKLSRAG
jgi:tetratricopeptide (TPR) repeat protein